MNAVKEGKKKRSGGGENEGSYIRVGEPRLWKREESKNSSFGCHDNDAILVSFTIHTHFSIDFF